MNLIQPIPATRPVAVRVLEKTQQDLELLARVIGTNVADQARAAISIYLMSRLLNEDLDSQIEKAKRRFEAAVETVRSTNPAQVGTESPTKAAKVTGVQMSVRLDQVQLSRLTALALVDDNTLADQLRCALDAYLKEQRGDERLVRARARLDQEQAERSNQFRVESANAIMLPPTVSVPRYGYEADEEVAFLDF